MREQRIAHAKAMRLSTAQPTAEKLNIDNYLSQKNR
jgi:hypothetical protein